jgi:hypothetical protein
MSEITVTDNNSLARARICPADYYELSQAEKYGWRKTVPRIICMHEKCGSSESTLLVRCDDGAFGRAVLLAHRPERMKTPAARDRTTKVFGKGSQAIKN